MKLEVNCKCTFGCARLCCFNGLPVCMDKYTALKLCFYFHQVSSGSIVWFEKGNFSLSAETEEKNFPERNEHLLQWAQKEYGAVTSFTDLKISRNIYIKIGEGKTKRKQANKTQQKYSNVSILRINFIVVVFHCFFILIVKQTSHFPKRYVMKGMRQRNKIKSKDQTLALVSF